MKLTKILLLVLFTLLTVPGCDVQFGGGFGSTDSEYMDHIKEELTKAGIEYSEEKNRQTELGVMQSIRYSPKHNENVDELRDKVSRRRSHRSAIKVDDEIALKYFTKLLEENGFEYRVLEKDGDKRVEWYPENNEEKRREIFLKYAEFGFYRKHGKSK